MTQVEEMAAFAEVFRNSPRTGDSLLRATAFGAGFNVTERPVKGCSNFDCFMTTVEKCHTIDSHIFFLHGGGHKIEASLHKDLIEHFAALGFRVTAVAYPLAPEHQYLEQHEAVWLAFKQLEAEYPDDRFVLFGDSCGADLSLELCFRLKREGDERRPLKAAFVSPACDMSLTDPRLLESAKVDRTLPLDCLQLCADAYAPSDKLTDPLVSPIYAPDDWYEGLGEFLIYYSDSEILYPDAERLIAKLKSTGCSVSAFRAAGQVHDYVLQLNVPESIYTIAGIAEFYK